MQLHSLVRIWLRFQKIGHQGGLSELSVLAHEYAINLQTYAISLMVSIHFLIYFKAKSDYIKAQVTTISLVN